MLMVLNTRRMALDTGQLQCNLSTRKNLNTFDTTATCCECGMNVIIFHHFGWPNTQREQKHSNPPLLLARLTF